MRQAVEAQVVTPSFELGEQGLRQILSDVIEEVRRSVSQDIDGAEVLHSLLTASWLQSLLKVYECLQRCLTDCPAPALDFASGLSLQLLIDIRSLPYCSEEAKELYRLLRQPHMQALLSAHDTVAQKDYEPVLPPMPDELPDDEEATRIVCLVKNKQPLLCGLSDTSHACARRCRSGTGSAWSVHSDETFGVQSPAPEHLRRFSCCEVRRTYCHPAELPCCPAGVRPHLLACTPRHEVSYRKQTIHCSVCYTDLEQKLNQSAPSVYNPVGFGKKRRFQKRCLENSSLLRLHPSSIHLFIAIRINILSVFSGDHPAKESGPFTCAPYPPCLGVPCYLNKGTYFHPDLPQKLRAQSPCVRTAPPSPMQPRRVPEETPMETSNQERLDKLRTTVQQAASSMESSSKDIRVLGERMVAATDRMTETVQSLVLLTQVVDRLQTLLTSTRTDIKISHAEQSRCSSSSSASSLDAPSTSKGPSPITANHQGPPLTTVTTGKRSPGDPDVSRGLLTNGELELMKTANNVKGCRTSQRRKKKRKKPT
ncbi:uncharacterized protein mpp4b isoform X4 [Xiphophorus hellerii]|uniref:uncharacterized protein mpp4b isoform X4 n=1 Tax=Xiphophorus hellerii TaxID=8084 RepID=UPI0013B43CBA|nr:MAGUK p55 subfamily member 4 isoform X4 [Xiphophorus hellerii]